MTPDTITYYDLFAVPADATIDTIRRAYRQQIRASHPDLAPLHMRSQAEEKTKALNQAWATLSNPLLRAEYDRSLTSPEPDPQPDTVDDIVDDWGTEHEIVDDWGTETNPPPPTMPPPTWAPPTTRPRPARFGKVRTTPPAPLTGTWWHKIWLHGHGKLLLASRLLSGTVLALVLLIPTANLAEVLTGHQSWTHYASNIAATALLTLILVGPVWHRALGGKIRKRYALYTAAFIALPVAAFAGVAPPAMASPWMLGIGLLMVITAEVRHHALRTGRAY